MTSGLKAYAVTEDCENTGGIYFAKHRITAIKRFADEYNDGKLGGILCRRAPWADQWADSDEDVPARVMIEHGWHFECAECSERIDSDYLRIEDIPIEGVIGTQRSLVFCSDICESRYKLNKAIASDHQRRAIKALKDYVLRRFPDTEFRDDGNWKPHAYATNNKGAWQVEQAVVSFVFPGMKIAPATCRIERSGINYKFVGPIKPEYSCCYGDMDVFEAWVASTKSRTSLPLISQDR